MFINSSWSFWRMRQQAHRGLCSRDIIDSPFNEVHKIICMEPLQHTPVSVGPIWYGEANSVQQAYFVVRQRDNAPAQNKPLCVAAAHRWFNNLQQLLFLTHERIWWHSWSERITHIITLYPTTWNNRGKFWIVKFKSN
jgi:hypothetical protein